MCTAASAGSKGIGFPPGLIIDFEMNLAENLTTISDALRDGSYEMSGYYSFMVHDPKDRMIHALHYKDRVAQHCLCDEVLAPLLDRILMDS